MRAAVYEGPGLGLRVEDVPDPQAAGGQVVVRVERVGVCGTDLSLTKQRDTPTLLGPAIEGLFSAGAILGHEYGGEVVAVGPGVKRLELGDRVAPMAFAGCGACAACLTGAPRGCVQATMRMGGYAEYAAVYEHATVRLPEEFSPAEGALVEPMATSLRTTAAAGIEPGARVLVLGAGALGLGIVYFAKRVGALRVAAVARSAGKAPVATAMGADAFLQQGPDLLAEAPEALGGPPDVVFEAAGVVGLIDQAIMAAKPGGTIVSAGMCLDPEMTSHAIAALKSLTLRYNAAYTLSDFEKVVELLPEAKIESTGFVAAPVGFDTFPDAFASLRRGGASHKILLDPGA